MTQTFVFRNLVFLTFFTSPIVLAEEKSFSKNELPQSMASLGDSITAGAVASYSRANMVNPFRVMQVAMDLLGALATGSMRPIEKRYLNWSTGLDPYRRLNSHAFRLKSLNPQLKIFNAAFSGAESSDVLENELPQLLKWSQKNLRQDVPDYVTVLIGANDICGKNLSDMTSPSEFQANIDRMLKFLLSRNKKSKVMVADIPALEKVQDNAGFPLFRFKPLLMCGDLWARIQICSNVLKNSSQEARKIVSARVHLFNRILEDSVDRHRSAYGDRVRFAPSLYSNGVNANEVAADCFHPNIDGQRRIANATWEQSWWSGFWNVQRHPTLSEKNYNIDPEWYQ